MFLTYFLLSSLIPRNNSILKVDCQTLSYQEMVLKEEVIDYAMQDFLYVLTARNIYGIDTASFRIVDRTPLPQKFNNLTIGKDEIFLISMSEIIVLNKNNLAFKTGIGIEPGDYQPMAPPAQLPDKNLIYLVTNNEKRSAIKVIDRVKAKRVKTGSFIEIKKFYYLPEEKAFIILTSSGLHLLDLNLKIKKSIKFNFPGEDFFYYKKGYIITNQQAICAIDMKGRIIDFQPVLLPNATQNCGFIFWNSDYMVLIDPFTMRLKNVLMNDRNISEIYVMDCGENLCINRDNELFLMDVHTGSIRPFSKHEYAVKKPVETKFDSEDSLFYLQLGAFSEFEYARNLCDSIKKTGLPTVIDSSLNNLYRVKLGGFVEKELALEIMENFSHSCWLVFHKRIDYLQDKIFNFHEQNYYLKNGIIKKE